MEVSQDELRRPSRPLGEDPLEISLRRNIRHPEMEYSLTAIEHCDDYHVEQYMRRISSGGWRRFLSNIDKRGARAFFAYLAKSEGRKVWGFVHADTSPLLDEQIGEIVSY